MRIARVLWIIAAIFVIACFFSGAWLGKVLSSMPSITAPRHASLVAHDEATLRTQERQTAIATAIASPAAVLILFLTVLVASAMFTGPGPRETD